MGALKFKRASIASAVLLSLFNVGRAAEYSWNVAVGDWSVATNWTSAVPTANDDAWITNGGTATVTQLGEVCNNLYLDGASSLQLTSRSLTVSNNAYVGYSGTGSFMQSGGTNSLPSGNLMVGWNPGGSGSYTLSGSGLLSGASGEFVGYYGRGSFTQSGGTNSFPSSSNLYLGASTGGNGSYNLGGSGLLSGAQYEYVGYSDSGSFSQSGGTNSLGGGLELGGLPSGNGSYNLTGSGLLSGAGGEYVGYYGRGSFTQSGGTNSGNALLYIGWNAASNGTYNLSGSGLLTSTVENVGLSGTGSFTQSGGTNSLGSGGGLYLGASTGGNGSYSLSGSGLLTGADGEFVGYYGRGNFTQSGGTNSGGTNSGNALLYIGWNAASNGTYNLTGSGLLSGAGGEYVGYYGTGSFTQSGGTNSLLSSNGGLNLGLNAASNGTYNLTGSGLLTGAISEFVGYYGKGSFSQSGGTNTLPFGVLYLGWNAGSSGTYNLSGSGLLSGAISEFVGYSGTGSFTQSGGTNSVSGTLFLAQFAGSTGTYNLNGGLLSLAGITAGSGAGALNFGGGTLGAAVPWSSSVNMTLTGSGGNATVDSTGGSIGLSGNLSGPGGLTKIGAGTLVLSGTNTYGGGTYVLAGTLIVDSNKALLSGTNLTVGGGGTLFFGPTAAAAPNSASPMEGVPEPSTLALVCVCTGALGLIGDGARRRRIRGL